MLMHRLPECGQRTLTVRGGVARGEQVGRGVGDEAAASLTGVDL